ncbi:MAG: hypothetical protein OQK51_23820, partial [Kangiellaceae bacterium]|nr:hypothetical protein [Kangiellaceae bacterium]
IGIPDEETRHGLVDFLMEFDSDLAPVVGQQITLNAGNAQSTETRVDFLIERASTNFMSKILGGGVKECDLIANGNIGNEMRGFLFQPSTSDFVSDRSSENSLSINELKALAKQEGNGLTFTCQVPGMGYQMALDRDLDGVLNRDET